MKRREDIYNLGNDYFQDTKVYFVTADSAASAQAGIESYKAYSDGLYHFTTQPVYELSGGASALNKRIFNIPQSAFSGQFDTVPTSAWQTFSAINDASAVFTDNYAKGIVVGEDKPYANWDETPKAKDDED